MAHSLKITAQRSPSQEALALPTSCQLPFMLIFLSSTSHLSNTVCILHIYEFTNSPCIQPWAPWEQKFSSILFFFAALRLPPMAALGTPQTAFWMHGRAARGTNEKEHTGAQGMTLNVLWFWSGSTRRTVCFTLYRHDILIHITLQHNVKVPHASVRIIQLRTVCLLRYTPWHRCLSKPNSQLEKAGPQKCPFHSFAN